MLHISRQFCLLALVLFLTRGGLWASGQSATWHRFGVGVNYLGGQLDWRPNHKRMWELRYQTGSDHENGVESKASVFSLRTYRYFRDRSSVLPFYGFQTSYINTSQSNNHYEASGPALGGFFGLGYKLSSHLLFNIDVGPYFIMLSEKNTKEKESSVNFVADVTLIFFL